MAIRKRIQISDNNKTGRVTVPQDALDRKAELKKSRLQVGDVIAGPNLSGETAQRLRNSYLRGKKCIGTFRWSEALGPMEIYDIGIDGYHGVIYPDGAVIISPLRYWESRMKALGPPPTGETLSDRLIAKYKPEVAAKIKSGRVRVEVDTKKPTRVRISIPVSGRVRV